MDPTLALRSRRPRRLGSVPRGRATVAVLSLVALLGACSAGADDSIESTESEVAGGGAAPDTGGDVGGVDGGGSAAEPAPPSGSTDVPAQLAASGRERVRTAWITLELEDPEAAVDEVTATAESHGGFVALADLARDDGTGELSGTVTVRVPSDALMATLDALEDLAVDAPERRIEEQDVGAELTDLRAQLTNLTAYEEELRALLTEVREATSDPDDLLPVVERLQSVRSDIDRARAQRDRLEDRVALSTITVSLTPTPGATPVATTSWTPLRTLEEALAASGRALTTLADVAIWLVVTGVPVALVIAIPTALVWRGALRRRRPSPGGAPDPPPA